MAIVFNPDELAVSVKQEQHQSPPQPQPQRALVKSEPKELSIVAQPPKEANFLKSINELRNLSASIDAFMRRYDELQKHLDFIQSAIDMRSNELASSPNHQQQPQPPQQIQAMETAPPQPIQATETAPPQQMQTELGKALKAAVAPTPSPPPPKSEVRSLCEMMCGRGLRKYIISQLSNVPKLREEVPSALKYAPKPAKLVLDCFGRFFLQGRRAYEKDSPMIPGREASILVLEFFLLMMENETAMDAQVKQEAEQDAVAWRKRLMAEGGVSRACEIDARGLLLLVACYGIPKVFSNDDVWHLVESSNSTQIAEALRRSRALVSRVSEIIEGMMKNGMKVEAVDVACTFGIEDKFPAQKILTSFLQESEALKNRRIEANNSPMLLKEAHEKHLASLKSVMKFLEDRKLDHTKLLPDWQFKEKIMKLENDIADLNKKIDDKMMSKRKADENELLNNLKIQDTKRQRFTAKGSPLISSTSVGLHDPRAASHVDGQSSYNGSVRINLLDGGFSGRVINYPAAPSIQYVSGAGSLPENVFGTMSGGGGVMHTTGVGLSAVYGMPSAGSSAAVHRDMLIDGAGPIMGKSGPPYGWHGLRDGPLHEVSLGQIRQPASSLYGPSPSIEGFAGLPNSPPAIAANGGSASDLYGFADAVGDSAYSSTRRTGPLPPVVGSHHSSYMY